MKRMMIALVLIGAVAAALFLFPIESECVSCPGFACRGGDCITCICAREPGQPWGRCVPRF